MSTGQWSLPDFGVQGSATALYYYNTVELSGNTLTMGSSDSLWDVGARTTYPTVLDVTFSK